MSTKLIQAPDLYDSDISIVAEAMELQAAALREAESIDSISDEFEANCAAEAMQSLKQLEKRITESHKVVKEPYLSVTRKLDEIKRDYLDPIKGEHSRISAMLGAYQAAERQKKLEAEREARRKERELIEQQQAKQLEAMESGDQEALAKADEELRTAQVAIKQETASKHGAVKGVKVRTTVCYEIIDEAALLKERSDLFSPDDRKIKAALKISQSIPGLKVWEEQKAY